MFFSGAETHIESKPMRGLLSVVMPTYQTARDSSPPRALESVRAQAVDGLELVVVDDVPPMAPSISCAICEIAFRSG